LGAAPAPAFAINTHSIDDKRISPLEQYEQRGEDCDLTPRLVPRSISRTRCLTKAPFQYQSEV